jgi:hypothetical protein
MARVPRAAHALALAVALLMILVSAADLVALSESLQGLDLHSALGVVASTAGVLVPGFAAEDLFNLLISVPLLVGTLWFARRGSLIGALLLPGVLFYVLYTYGRYLIGAPFSVTFVPAAALVALSAAAILAGVRAIDSDAVQVRLAEIVPARTVGGILIALAVLTIGQDASGAVSTALAAGLSPQPLARDVWVLDLAVGAPATLIGGILLWRRSGLGYVLAAGLLLAYGVTPLALAAILALQPLLTGAPIDGSTMAGLLVFAAVSFAPLWFFARGRERGASTRESSRHATVART